MFAKVVLFCGFGVLNLFGMRFGFGSISCARRSGVVLAAAANQVSQVSSRSLLSVPLTLWGMIGQQDGLQYNWSWVGLYSTAFPLLLHMLLSLSLCLSHRDTPSDTPAQKRRGRCLRPVFDPVCSDVTR